MNILLLDIGNTHIKYAFLNNGIRSACAIASIEKLLDGNLNIFNEIDALLISKVGKLNERLPDLLQAIPNHKWVNADLNLPFSIHYKTPATLGADRIAGAAASIHLAPNKNRLVIDAGTCVTYDILTATNEYLGGHISPGIHMRLKAMHQFTDSLPLVELIDETFFPGTNTQSSILSGATEGLTFEMQGFIRHYESIYPDLQIFLSGGDAKFLAKRLKNSIFVEPELVFIGLQHIAEINF